MLPAGKKKALPHEIVSMVTALQKGAHMDEAMRLSCAKLILDLENERRKMASLAASAETVIKARETDWKGQLAEANKVITALKTNNRDVCAKMRAIAFQLNSAANKFRVDAKRNQKDTTDDDASEVGGASEKERENNDIF